MLGKEPVVNAVIIDFLLGVLWHYAVFFICIFINKDHFDEKKRLYQPHKWERGGRIYSDVLKIQRWKDLLPQHVGKDGFSKGHLDDVSVEYLDEFIMETCRGEWNHTVNCFYAVILFLINDLWLALVLTIALFVINVPFVLIQRYNRFRLQKLRRYVMRKCGHT